MPDITIPNPKTKRWEGQYLGEYDGNFHKTYNIDLESSPGNITLSRRVESLTDSTVTDMTNLDLIVNFLRTNADGTDRWWALNRDGVLARTDSITPDTSWTEDTLVGTPTNGKDMTVHGMDTNADLDSNLKNAEEILLVTRDSAVSALNDTGGDTWSVFGFDSGELDTGVPHPIEYFPLRRISLIGSRNVIHTIDKDKVKSARRLVLPTYYQAEHIFTTAYRAWILCSGKYGRNGAIVEWDGSSETYNYIYDLQSIHPVTGVNYHEIPIVVNNRGLILEYDGNGFSPMIRNGRVIAFPCYSEVGNGFPVAVLKQMESRGMTVADDGLIYINSSNVGMRSYRQMAGVWCLNPITGAFYSKFSLPDADYGQQTGLLAGAIKSVNIPASISTSSVYLLMGGRAASNNRIWIVRRQYDNTERRGYFITSPFLTSNVQEIWDTIWAKFTAFRTADDEIIIKAKGVRNLREQTNIPLYGNLTWASTTTFTVTLNANDDALVVGDEVEITEGVNGGLLAHITAITGAHAAIQTITIDETAGTAAGTSEARFNRWKKLAVIDNNTKYFAPASIGIHATFVQFKVELRGASLDYYISDLIAAVKPLVIKKR